MKKVSTYNESSIEVAQGLEGVRLKPAMYIGDGGAFHLLKEIVDNAIDESQAGFNNKVGVSIDGKNIYVWDEGRGIPSGPHPKFKNKSTLEVIFTMLHAGGKLRAGSAYKSSGGTHGVGASVVNALSEEMNVSTFRDGKWHHMSFSKGKVKGKLTQRKITIPGLKNQPKKGTVVHFRPDSSLKKVFGKTDVVSFSRVNEWFDTAAYIVPGTRFVLISGKDYKEYYEPEGMKSYLLHVAGKKGLDKNDLSSPFVHQDDSMDVVISWGPLADEHTDSFVNVIKTSENGTHVNGLNQALLESLKPYELKKHRNDKGANYRSDDIRTGMICAINYRMQAPEFGGQVKNKLVSKEATDVVKSTLQPKLSAFFSTNKALAKQILDRALDARKAADQYKKAREALSKIKNTRGKRTLPERLVISTGQDIKKRELFLVEGDSASGTAKAAREKEYQEILPLSGKPPNVLKDTTGKFFTNERIIEILASIGFDPTGKQDIEKTLRVGKIILLSDGDPDGHHINALLLSLFQKVIPQAFEKGMVYVVDAPLFMVFYKNQNYFGESIKDLLEKVKEKNPTSNVHPSQVTRIKGWGEIDPGPLREIAFDPSTRSLKKVNAPSKNQLHQFELIMGQDSAMRKELLGLT